MFAIEPWVTKSPKKVIAGAIGAAALAFAAQVALLDRLVAEPLVSMSQPSHHAQRPGFGECIEVTRSNLVRSC
jgi:hypothetical protein